jgi:hypothetical protein
LSERMIIFSQALGMLWVLPTPRKRLYLVATTSKLAPWGNS